MRITYDRDKNRLTIGEVVFTVTNNVRNEIDPRNVRRQYIAAEVRYTIPRDHSKGVPYMPRKFPKGVWEITGVEWQEHDKFDIHDYGPVRIRSNAHQTVQVWSLDVNGGYDKPIDKYVEDYGYLFHYSESRTTLGCGRFDKQESAIKAARMVEDGLKNGKVILEVI